MFKAIWGQYSSDLQKFINSKIKNNEITKDILQDVAIKVYTNIDTLKETSKAKSWLFSIANNTIMDHFRKQKNTIVFDENLNNSYEPQEPQEIYECITQLVNHLPQKYQTAIKQVEFDELSQKEFALNNNISYTNAKIQLQRARSQLGELLSECCEIEHGLKGEILDFKQKNKNCEYNC